MAQQQGQIERIYSDLHEASIETVELLRLFPVGRGASMASLIPTTDEYKEVIRVIRVLEARYGKPKLKLQCALKMLDGVTELNHVI